MSSTLDIRLRKAEGSLLRVMVIIRRLGFETMALAAVTTEDGLHMDVIMTLDSTRSAENLVRQIAKLHDVVAVSKREPSAQASFSTIVEPTPAKTLPGDGGVARSARSLLEAVGH